MSSITVIERNFKNIASAFNFLWQSVCGLLCRSWKYLLKVDKHSRNWDVDVSGIIEGFCLRVM